MESCTDEERTSSVSAASEDREGRSSSSAMAISGGTEVEQAKCECCGLAEECTPEYISRVRDMHCGRWVCGLCAEAVKEEHGGVGRTGDDSCMKAALDAHMSMCMQFNRRPHKREGTTVVDFTAAMMRRLMRRRTMDAASPRSSAPTSPDRHGSSTNISCSSCASPPP